MLLNSHTSAAPGGFARWPAAARVVCCAALAGTVAFIFSNSLAVADASNQASGGVQQLLYALFDRCGVPALKEWFTMHRIRKLAHFAEYALLGFWWPLCLRAHGRRPLPAAGWPVLACLLTALTDETLQLFSTGRSGQVSDVWLDFAGALTGFGCGLLALWLGAVLFTRLRSHKKE